LDPSGSGSGSTTLVIRSAKIIVQYDPCLYLDVDIFFQIDLGDYPALAKNSHHHEIASDIERCGHRSVPGCSNIAIAASPWPPAAPPRDLTCDGPVVGAPSSPPSCPVVCRPRFLLTHFSVLPTDPSLFFQVMQFKYVEHISTPPPPVQL